MSNQANVILFSINIVKDHMRRYLFFITLALPFFVSCTKEKLEYKLGNYRNQKNISYLQVSAIVKNNGELRLFFEIPYEHKDIQEMKIEIKGEHIPELRKELLDVKHKMKRLQKTYRKKRKETASEIKIDNKFPPMRFCWEINGSTNTSKWNDVYPMFHAEKGNYYVYIKIQGNETITCKWEFSDEKDIDSIIEWLDEDYLRDKYNEKRMKDSNRIK